MPCFLLRSQFSCDTLTMHTSASTASSSLLSPLSSLLQPPLCAADSSLECAPLKLIEETLSCPADFLILHTIKNKLAGAADGVTTAAADAQTHSDPTAVSSSPPSSAPLSAAAAAASLPPSAPSTGPPPRVPGVLLWHFRHPAAHYTQIARKWGVALEDKHAHTATQTVEIHLSNDLGAAIRSEAESAEQPQTDHAPSDLTAAASLDAFLDRSFRVESAASPASAPSLGVGPFGDSPSATSASSLPSVASPLSRWVSSVLRLRSRHSSLLVVVDSLEWLCAHASGREIEVADALATLRRRLAEMDAAECVCPQSRSSLLLVCQGDALTAASPAHSLLRRSAATFIRLRALRTGWTAEVSGVITVQQQAADSGYWTPARSAQYKIYDSNVKLAGADTMQI